jgi:hypothetical protein
MKAVYFSTFQLILLAQFAALIVISKIALRLPLQLPGHSGLFWIAIMIVASQVVPRFGATSLVGLTSGLLAAFLGLGDFGALNTFLSYTMVGVGTDLALLLLRNPENLVVAAFVGAIGHLAKFYVMWGLSVLTGAPVGFVALGMIRSLVGYLVFGFFGGASGWVDLDRTSESRFLRLFSGKKIAAGTQGMKQPAWVRRN